MTFLHKACSPLIKKKEWKGGEEIARHRKLFHLRLWTLVSMVAARRHPILNNTISSKAFSKSQSISISKGERERKKIAFISIPLTSSKGDFYFWECVFKSLPFKWVCHRVMSHQHMFRTVSGNVLGNHSESSDTNWWVLHKEERCKHSFYTRLKERHELAFLSHLSRVFRRYWCLFVSYECL